MKKILWFANFFLLFYIFFTTVVFASLIYSQTDVEEKQIDVLELENRIHDLTNDKRFIEGISSLELDYYLSSIARFHSEDMAYNSFFDHFNLDGDGPNARANALNYKCVTEYEDYYIEGISENIFMTNYYDDIEDLSQRVVDSWMQSESHRANLLNASYEKQGIGVYVLNNDVYITQDFC